MSVEHTDSVKRVLEKKQKDKPQRVSSMTHQYGKKRCTEKRFNAIQKFLSNKKDLSND